MKYLMLLLGILLDGFAVVVFIGLILLGGAIVETNETGDVSLLEYLFSSGLIYVVGGIAGLSFLVGNVLTVVGALQLKRR